MLVRVVPIRPIHGVKDFGPIRATEELDLDELKIRRCLLNGRVYKLDGTQITQMNLSEILKKEVAEEAKPVDEKVEETSTQDEKKEVAEEAKPVDEKVEETSAHDEKKEVAEESKAVVEGTKPAVNNNTQKNTNSSKKNNNAKKNANTTAAK